MKQTFIYHTPILAPINRQTRVGDLDASIEAFQKKAYLESLHLLLDAIDEGIRKKYGNAKGDAFCIPHGSVYINVQWNKKELKIRAPFVALPEENQVALMRQVAGLNFNDLDLAKLVFDEEGFTFEYACPVAFSHPRKIYHVLEEICRVSDKYDYEFQEAFQARRLKEPLFHSYAPEAVETVYEVIQQSCEECLNALPYFETSRKFSEMWHVIVTTFLKVVYVAQPRGKLLNTLQKAIRDMDRDLPLSALIAGGKQVIRELQEKTKEELSRDLYEVHTFISGRPYSTLQNIREDFEKMYKQVTTDLESGDERKACLRMTYKFYETYYHYQMQEKPDRVLAEALSKASGRPWGEAAPMLYKALESIMQGPFKMQALPGPIAA